MVIEERTPRPWPERVDVFTSTIAAVASVVDAIDSPHQPGMGEWDAGTLARHTYRAISTLQRYLADARSGVPDVPDAAGYLATYLARRDTDPAAMDRAVTARAVSEDVGSFTALATAFHEAVAWSASDLPSRDPDLILQTPFGGITLGAYLSTRLFELVVHGLDLAHAAGTEIDLPEPALDDACALLMQLASRRNRQSEVLRALTGRTPKISPLLQ